jgi:hypothetical protein
VAESSGPPERYWPDIVCCTCLGIQGSLPFAAESPQLPTPLEPAGVSDMSLSGFLSECSDPTLLNFYPSVKI